MTSAMIFATTISYFCSKFAIEPVQILLNLTSFSWALLSELCVACSSVSQASTLQPSFANAILNIPLPHPTSKVLSPLFAYFCKSCKQEFVLSWCPEPKARAGSIMIFVTPLSGSSQLGLI